MNKSNLIIIKQFKTIMKHINNTVLNAQPNTQTNINRADWHGSDIAAPSDSAKSTINKISGRQIYLKDRPEALFLMQSAQIERLTQYLNDYKCKYRLLSRQTLDRQSYETQIKELFQRDNVNKLEIDRLNSTIKAIITTNQEYRQQIISAQSKNAKLQNDKHQAEGKSNMLQKQLQATRQSHDKYYKKSDQKITELNLELSSVKYYLQSVMNNNLDLVSKVNTIPNYQRRIMELETQVSFYTDSIKTINKELEEKAQKIYNQDKILADLQEKNKYNEKLHQNLQDQVSKKHSQLLQTHVEHSKAKNDFEIKLKNHSNLIDSKNIDLQNITNVLKDHIFTIETSQKVIQQSKRLTEQLKRQISQKQTRNSVLNQEILRLKQIISTNQVKINNLNQTNQSANQSVILKDMTIKKLTKQFQELKNSSIEKENNYESVLKEKVKQIIVLQYGLKEKQTINDNLMKLIGKNEEDKKMLENLIKGLKEDIDKQNTIINELKGINSKFQQQNTTLNKMVSNKVIECQALRKQMINNQAELRNLFNNSLEQTHKTHSNGVKKLKQDHNSILLAQRNNHKAKHQQILKAKDELQQSHIKLLQQLQGTKAKNLQIQKALREYILTHQNAKKMLTSQIKQRDLHTTELKQKVQKLKSDSQQKLNNIKELKEQIALVVLQKNQLTDQNILLTTQVGEVKKEREQLSNVFQNKIKQNEAVKRKMIDLEDQLRESFQSAFQQQNESHKAEVQTIKHEILLKTTQQIQPLKQKSKQLQQKIKKLQQKLKDYETTMANDKLQIQSLTSSNEKLKKTLQETKTGIISHYQNEFIKANQYFVKQYDRQHQQKLIYSNYNEKLTLTIIEYQSKIALLSQQLQRLHSVLNMNSTQYKNEIESLKSNNVKFQTEISRLTEQSKIDKSRQQYLLITITNLERKVSIYDKIIRNIQSEFIAVQMITKQLKSKNEFLTKKLLQQNTILLKSVHRLNEQFESLQKETSVGNTTTLGKQTLIHKQLGDHYTNIQQLLNNLSTITIVGQNTTQQRIIAGNK